MQAFLYHVFSDLRKHCQHIYNSNCMNKIFISASTQSSFLLAYMQIKKKIVSVSFIRFYIIISYCGLSRRLASSKTIGNCITQIFSPYFGVSKYLQKWDSYVTFFHLGQTFCNLKNVSYSKNTRYIICVHLPTLT